jgi:hypothetical protein
MYCRAADDPQNGKTGDGTMETKKRKRGILMNKQGFTPGPIPERPVMDSLNEATPGEWKAFALDRCELPGYAYAVTAHAATGCKWPVALVVTEADAALIATPDRWEKTFNAIEALKAENTKLRHAAEVALEIARTMADDEHCMHEALGRASKEQWAQWRDFFHAALDKAKA